MSEEIKEPEKEKPPAIGNIFSKKGGAPQIMTDTGPVPFDVDYIIGRMKKILAIKNSMGIQKTALENYIRLLESGAEEVLPLVMKRLKVLSGTRGTHGSLLLDIEFLLGRLKMMKNMNFAPPKEEEKPEEPPVVNEADNAFKEVLEKINLPEGFKGLPISNHTEDFWRMTSDNKICFGGTELQLYDINLDKDYLVVCVDVGHKCLLVFDNTKEVKE